MLRKRPPLTGLDTSLPAQRNQIRTVLGRQWWHALPYWAPLLAGPIACALFRIRYRARPSPRAQAQDVT